MSFNFMSAVTILSDIGGLGDFSFSIIRGKGHEWTFVPSGLGGVGQQG